MEEIRKQKTVAIGVRAHLPLITRIVAICVLVAGVVFVGISYYKLRNNKPFRLKSETPELSKEITGIIEGYEQHVMKEGRLYLLVKASRDITFSDGHHELENIDVAVYPPAGDKPDQITANRAIWIQKDSVITFLGSVNIETKDALKLKTESLTYDQINEVASTDAYLTFTRENVSGHCTGAVVEGKTKKLELKKDVEMIVAPEVAKDQNAKASKLRSRPVTIHSAHATFDQASMKLAFSGGVTAEQERDLVSGDNLYANLNQQKKLEKLELRGNSYLRTMETGRGAEMHAVDVDFYLDADQRAQRAVAMRDTRAASLDSDSDMVMTGASLVEANFQRLADRSVLKEMRTEGRSVMNLSAPK